jgi:recombination protein RecA
LGLAVDHEIVNKAGAWFSYGKEKLGQGKERTIETLQENEAMANEIAYRVKSVLKIGEDPGPGAARAAAVSENIEEFVAIEEVEPEKTPDEPKASIEKEKPAKKK